MSEHHESIAIVWPTRWPIEQDESHCTIIYLGDIADATFTKVDLWDAMSRMRWPMFNAKSAGVEMFGENKDIPVILLESVMAHTLQGQLTKILAAQGITSASEFTEYKPHISVDKVPAIIPDWMHIGPPTVWWGDER